MNWLKKLKLLKTLFNGTTTFYYAGGKWHFETRIKNKEAVELIKEYIHETERK